MVKMTDKVKDLIARFAKLKAEKYKDLHPDTIKSIVAGGVEELMKDLRSWEAASGQEVAEATLEEEVTWLEANAAQKSAA